MVVSVLLSFSRGCISIPDISRLLAHKWLRCYIKQHPLKNVCMRWVNERSRKRDCDRNITPNFIQIEWIDLSIYWIRSKERRKKKERKKQYYLKEFVAQWTRSLLIDAQCLTKMRSKRYFRSSFHYHRHLFIEFDLSIFKWYVTLSYFIFILSRSHVLFLFTKEEPTKTKHLNLS